MFTKTHDPMRVSSIRRNSDHIQTLPAITTIAHTEQGDIEFLVIATNFGKPVTRLILEALYVASVGGLTEEELVEMVNRIIECNGEKLKSMKILHELRASRWEQNNQEVSLNVSVDTLDSILTRLEVEGNLSFVVGHEVGFVRVVNSLDEVTMDLIEEIYDNNFSVVANKISNNNEAVVAVGRSFHKEDMFLNIGTNTLDFINKMSGNEYGNYETLAHAYRTDEHFSAHPEFYNIAHCECGGELVIRKNDWGEYTLMSCINPYCFEKLGISLADFARAMGIDGLGETTLVGLAKSVAFNNCIESGDNHCCYESLLMRENAIYLGDAASKLWNKFIDSIESYNGTVKDLVLKMNLPYMGEDASRILTYELLSNPDITPILLKQEAARKGKYDVKFVLNMWLYLADFKHVILKMAKNLNFNILEEYPICITKGVLLDLGDNNIQKMTKEKFVDFVNQKLSEAGVTFKIKLKKSVTHDCKALIADHDRNTGNCATAESYGIPIYTSREFIESLGGA